MSQSPVWSRWLLSVLACIIAVLAYNYFASQAFVKINIHTDEPRNFRIYWKTAEQANYTDAHSSLIHVYPKKHYYTAAMADLREVTHLRIDPTNGTELFRINEISIYQAGFETVRFFHETLKDLIPATGVGSVSYDKFGMVYMPSHADSSFEAAFSLKAETDSLWTHIWRIILFMAFAFMLLRAFPHLTEGLRYVPLLMFLILGFLFTMATISRPHAHPDEHAHIQAAQYYENHQIPPAVCDASTLGTYTNYGTSRLNTNELSYYLSGKFLQLLDPLPMDNYYKLRLFNITLFCLLILLAVLRPESRIVLAPMLISPQFWYVFSYYNSDAFAIFISLIIAYQVAAPSTMFRQLIQKNNSLKRPYLVFIGLALLACFLLLTKKNFYFFTLFLAGAASIAYFLNRKKEHFKAYRVLPLLGIFLSAGLAFSAWTFYQESINDFERGARTLQCREKTALPAFKPSAPLDVANWSLGFDRRGVSIPEMLDKGWARNVFMSAFGNFGYVAHPASHLHYKLVALMLLGLMLSLFYVVIRHGSAFQRYLLAGCVALFVMLVSVTIYKSWTVDYQPQGRYYFAMIPILGALLGWLRNIIPYRVLSFFILILAALGLFAFVSIGLLEIRKVGS